ncbi:MAG TPA: hypothetical protein DEQ14_12050 [Treponema sp.]|nr:hypothetical protein [Treponema sp.]
MNKRFREILNNANIRYRGRKMKMKQKIFLACLIFCITSIVFAQSETDFEIQIENDTVTIIGYKGKSRELNIPASIMGMPVTGIGTAAFRRSQLTSVTLPEGLMFIGDRAFHANRLSHITVPDSVTHVGTDAFTGQLHNYRTEGLDAFFTMTYKNEVTIILYNGWGGKVSFPGRINNMPVVAIERAAFSYKGISQITIPNTVRTIGNEAFAGNYLVEIIIPNSVTSIGHSAFSNNRLRNVVIPDSITSIGTSIFSVNPLDEDVREMLENRFGQDVVGNNNVIYM